MQVLSQFENSQHCHANFQQRRDFKIWAFEVYEREENVFIAGSWVSFLHITATGTYSYIEGGVSMQPM